MQVDCGVRVRIDLDEKVSMTNWNKKPIEEGAKAPNQEEVG